MSVGKNIPHDSAKGHVTGTSQYIDDRPRARNEVFVCYLGSPIACGELLELDYAEALTLEGVFCILTAKDVKHNRWGSIVKDQPLLVEQQIGYFDEPLCLIAAVDQHTALLAKTKIRLSLKEHRPQLALQEAIDRNDFLYTATPFRRGNAENELAQAPNVLQGHFFSGGQEHFYLENQAAVVYPLEGDQLEVHASTQHPTETQHLVAEACGLPFHQVSCICKRMGGGFGGKESQAAPFAAYAALVAQKLKRPARMVLTKDEDMRVTGKRHPVKSFYRVGFDHSGTIKVLDVSIFADGGAYADLSSSILERAMFHLDGAYYLQTVSIQGFVCRTNTASNTAFRGFGGPQGTLIIESIIEDISQVLGLDALDVRQRNCYGSNSNIPQDQTQKPDQESARDLRNITPYGQVVENNVLPQMFAQLRTQAEYDRRRKEISFFNKSSSQFRRGLSLTATKFGIAFTARHLNQGNALVHLHRDGTVQVSTGATEMGQGVYTKIQQIVAEAFGILPTSVRVLATSTERNANTSPTAASSGSDINGAAALKACDKIKSRLIIAAYHLMTNTVPTGTGELSETLSDSLLKNIVENRADFKFSKGQILWQGQQVPLLKAIDLAYFHRLSLSDYAHFRTENLGFDKKTATGRAFNYFTNGVALSEVQVNLDTGESKVLRTDILMDVGCSINPGIDRGQISGAFVQGMGWLTTEKLFYNIEGQLLSHSPTTYKIPNIQDTPREFNLDLFPNETTTMNVHRSKAVGEPPLVLGISVFTAIKDALASDAKSHSRLVDLKAPATPEEILFCSMRGRTP